MKKIKILALLGLFVCPMSNQAQTISKEALSDSIAKIKTEILRLQTEISLPQKIDLVLDNANNKYKIVKAFYYGRDLVICVQVIGESRSRINIGYPIEAYVNGYHYESIALMTEDVEFTLLPDVPHNVKFRLTLQNYKDLDNPNGNRIIDYFSIFEKNSESKIDFYCIPIEYED